jgi:IS5 family transposase
MGLKKKSSAPFEQLGTLPLSPTLLIELSELEGLPRQHIILISDRLLDGLTIAPEEKLYSIFEQHTEWVQKGKARPSVELGHRLLITTDQYGPSPRL